jgi:hypothetical protein
MLIFARRANHFRVFDPPPRESSPFRKNFSLSPSGKSILELAPSRAHQRGVSRSSRHVGHGMRWMRWRQARLISSRTRALPHTAKSCGPDIPTLISSLAEHFREATVARKPGHRGERAISCKTIARGMPGDSGVTVVTTLVCSFYFACEAAGALRARHSPCPLLAEGGMFRTRLAQKSAARSRSCGCLKFENPNARRGRTAKPKREVRLRSHFARLRRTRFRVRYRVKSGSETDLPRRKCATLKPSFKYSRRGRTLAWRSFCTPHRRPRRVERSLRLFCSLAT